MDPQQGEVRRLRDPRGGDLHAVFQTPGLLGISQVNRHGEPQPLRGHARGVRPGPVPAEPDDLSAGLGTPVDLPEDDDRQRLRTRRMA
jgi:hypothetical protein